jgi:hypothetical protein
MRENDSGTVVGSKHSAASRLTSLAVLQRTERASQGRDRRRWTGHSVRCGGASCSPPRRPGPVRELHWVMLGAMVLGPLTLTRLNPRLDRRRWIVAAAARAVRHAARARTNADSLRHLSTLRTAVCGDNRRANKQAWEWPHKKKQRPPGPPDLRRATRAGFTLWRPLSRQRA